MTSSRTAKAKGAAAQRELAAYLKEAGWPYAEPVGAGCNGRDILGTPGVAWEAKYRKDFDPLAWCRQAQANAYNDLPLVALRPHGLGPDKVHAWPVITPMRYAVWLLHAAGYGDGSEKGLVG